MLEGCFRITIAVHWSHLEQRFGLRYDDLAIRGQKPNIDEQRTRFERVSLHEPFEARKVLALWHICDGSNKHAPVFCATHQEARPDLYNTRHKNVCEKRRRMTL